MNDWGEWSRQAVAEMQAGNETWLTRFSLHGAPYRWDLGTAELTFERASDHVVADICVIGTVSEAQGTFRWAWANEAIPSTAMRGLEIIRAFGEAHDLPRLVTPEWPGSGRPELQTALAPFAPDLALTEFARRFAREHSLLRVFRES